MFKVIFWKIGLEFWNVVKLLYERGIFKRFLDKQPTQWNFAFAGNLRRQTLERRRLTFLNRQEFLLRDHRLTFSQPGLYQGQGFASVKPETGSVVFGWLVELHPIDVKRLLYFEAVPFLKKHRICEFDVDKKRAFYFQAIHEEDGLRPTVEYRDAILEAAQASELCPQSYVDSIKSLPILEERQLNRDIRFAIRWLPKHSALRWLVRFYDQAAFLLFAKWAMKPGLSRLLKNPLHGK